VWLNSLHASNSGAGIGTLTVGGAMALVELRLLAATPPVVLASVEIPIQLVAPSYVVSIDVQPDRLLLPIGGTAQLNADVQVVGNPPVTVIWYTLNDLVATVNDAGLVTAVGIGSGTVRGAVWPPQDDAAVYVYNPAVAPPFTFTMSGPTAAVAVNRDVGSSLTVTLSAQAVGPSVIFRPFTGPVEFWARVPGGQLWPLGVATSTVMQDNTVNRTFT
jgi:hypothetical protein